MQKLHPLGLLLGRFCFLHEHRVFFGGEWLEHCFFFQDEISSYFSLPVFRSKFCLKFQKVFGKKLSFLFFGGYWFQYAALLRDEFLRDQGSRNTGHTATKDSFVILAEAKELGTKKQVAFPDEEL